MIENSRIQFIFLLLCKYRSLELIFFDEDWVVSLRTFLRDELGSSWQIKAKKGTCQLRVRLEDGTRVYRHLGLKWNKASSPKIRVAVEEIRDLVIEKKVPLDEAIKRVKSNQAEVVISEVHPFFL